MTTRQIADLPRSIDEGLIGFANDLVANMRRSGACLHEDFPPAAVLAIADIPNASNEATSVALANALKAAWNAHCADVGQHKVADSTNTASSANATNLASAQTLLNELKGDFNAHIVSETYHHVGGAGGVAAPDTVSTSDASDQPSANALANALKAAFLRHFSSGAPTLVLAAS